MRRCLVLAALLTLTSGAASAQTVRLDFYRNPPEPKDRIFSRTYLKGAVDGYIAYTAAQAEKNRLFCIPETQPVPIEQAEEIMLRYAEKKQHPGTVPVIIPMLGALREAFPCPKE